jgi:surface protein
MATSTALGYNTGSTITGTQQIGSLAVVTATTVNYSPITNGGVTFWMGPDEELGYVVGIPVPSGAQTTPVSGVNAFLGFIRSTSLTEPSFLSMINGTFNQSLTTGAAAKTYLNNNGYWTSWSATTVTSDVFTSVWQTTTTNEVIELPYRTAGTYSGTIDWGDGSVSANSFANISHTYATAGIKTISISGVTKGFSFDNVRGSFTKIRDVTNWGNVRLSRVELNADNGFFYGCNGLSAITATDLLSTSGITDFSNMFRNCSSLTNVNRINEWNTSNVTAAGTMFSGAILFNSNIGSWDTKKFTNISYMFDNADAFNQNINNWNTSALTNTYGTFNGATSFNQPLSGWNTSNITSAGEMFFGTPFNQNINNWDTSKFTTLFRIFRDTTTFNQPLSGWNVSNVTNFSEVFYGNNDFNQNINNWVTSAATSMSGMFGNGSQFNQPLSGWSTSNVLSMEYMFGDNNQFNQSIGNWNVSKVTDMAYMFQNATAFNQNIGSWNISGVTNFTSFMAGKTAANYSTTNLDEIYNGWSTKTPKSGIVITFNTIKYTAAGSSGKSVLTSAPYNWSITDGGI